MLIFSYVIGEIIGMQELKEVNVSGRQTKLLNLQLRDLGLVIYQPKYFIICIMYLHLYWHKHANNCIRESVIDVTLWEKWAEDLYSYVKGYKDGSIVLVGSLMKIKTYFKNVYLTFTIRDSLIWFLIFSRQDLCPKSSFSTKLFINSSIAEITEFKER